MKYLSYQGFIKHLEQAGLEHLSSAYAVVSNSLLERQAVTRRLIQLFGQKYPGIKTSYFDFNRGISALFAEAEPSLFFDEPLMIVKRIDRLLENEAKKLTKLVLAQRPIIFWSKEFSSIKALYEKAKQDLVVVDLNAEKPWERSGRYLSWSLAYLRRHNFQVNQAHLETLIASFDSFDDVKNELDKLILFSHGKSEITQDAFESLCVNTKEPILWKVSEELIFKRSKDLLKKINPKALDPSNFQAFLGALRYHLELAMLLKDGEAKSLEKPFSNVHPKTIDKHKKAVANTSLESLKGQFQEVLKVENISRSKMVGQELLFTSLVAKLLTR